MQLELENTKTQSEQSEGKRLTNRRELPLSGLDRSLNHALSFDL